MLVRPPSLRRSALLACALTVALATAACTGDARARRRSPTPSPSEESGKPTEKPRKVTFGAYGSEEEVAAFQSVVDSFNAALDHPPGHPAVVARPRVRPRGRARRQRARRVPDLAHRPRPARRRRGAPAGEPAARRARGRLRRPLLARRRRRLRDGRRAPVHGVLGVADGHLLQHRPRRLRQDGAPRARRADRRRRGRARPLDARGVRRGRAVRLAPRRHARRLDRPDPPGPGAVHLLRRRRGLRRRPRAHVARLLRRQHPRGAERDPRHPARPHASRRPTPSSRGRRRSSSSSAASSR